MLLGLLFGGAAVLPLPGLQAYVSAPLGASCSAWAQGWAGPSAR
jgi:hypothetical protein